MQSSTSSLSVSLQEPLLITATAADDRCSNIDQDHDSSPSARLSLDDDENEGSQKILQADKNELGCDSCIHWYITKFLFPLLLILQQAMTLVLLVPFLFLQFGCDYEADSSVHILPPCLVIGSSLALFGMLIWIFIHEKAPATQEILLRILHPAIHVEMNIVLMLIQEKKMEIAIVTLLSSMVGVGAFVLFSVHQSRSSSSSSSNEETAGDLLKV